MSVLEETIGSLDRRAFMLASLAGLAVGKSTAQAARSTASVGIYNTVFQLKTLSLSENIERAKRLTDAGLHQFHVAAVTPRTVSETVELFQRLREVGVQGGIRPKIPLKNVQGWFDGSTEEALQSYAPLDGVCRDIYLGHEVFEWADRKTRQQITLTSKRVLPKTKVRLYYGHLEAPERHGIAAHKGGSSWANYAIVDSAHEPDIIHFTTSHLEGPLTALIRAYDYAANLIKRVAPDKLIYCHMNFFEESLASPAAQEKLKQFVDHIGANGVNVFLLRSIAPDKQKKGVSDKGIALIGRILRTSS